MFIFQERPIRSLFFALAGLLLSSACVAPPPPPIEPLSSTTVVVTPELEVIPFSVEEESTMENTEAPNPLVRSAVKDLATRLDVPLAEIEILSAESTIWPDTSLGCPRPGMAYRQVQRDGMRILLQVDGRTFHYHSGGAKEPFLCENPAPLPDTPSEPDPNM